MTTDQDLAGERPILFTGSNVRAILEGRKTQTRRVFKVRGVDGTQYAITSPAEEVLRFDDGTFHYLSTAALSGPYPCPYGQPGDKLWVRETWGQLDPVLANDPVFFRADYSDEELREQLLPRWRPSIHMPRSASRILLEVTDVRVERVQDISEEDARAEGCHPEYAETCMRLGHPYDCIPRFRDIWNAINEKRGFGWDANPWVWALTFKRVTETAK